MFFWICCTETKGRTASLLCPCVFIIHEGMCPRWWLQTVQTEPCCPCTPLSSAFRGMAQSLLGLEPLTHLLGWSKNSALCAGLTFSMSSLFKARGFCQTKAIQTLQTSLGLLRSSIHGGKKKKKKKQICMWREHPILNSFPGWSFWVCRLDLPLVMTL